MDSNPLNLDAFFMPTGAISPRESEGEGGRGERGDGEVPAGKGSVSKQVPCTLDPISQHVAPRVTTFHVPHPGCRCFSFSAVGHKTARMLLSLTA